MNWLTKLWLKRQIQPKLDAKAKRDALKLIASPPVRDYLVALMTELVREGIFLPPDKQEGARFTIDLLTKEIQKGDMIFKEETERTTKGIRTS